MMVRRAALVQRGSTATLEGLVVPNSLRLRSRTLTQL
jgi:hypothetical protein